MKGERVALTITGTGMDGEGVARLDKLAVFVDGALLGEKVEAIITLRKKNFARARIIKVIEKSPMRCEPFCSVYYRCGGCNLQHINYSEQLIIKKNELISCLKKQLRMDVAVDDVVPSDRNLGYRNKLQLPIGEDDKGNIIAGFYRDNSHIIVPITACPLHGEWAESIIKPFLLFANSKRLTAFNEIKQSGLLRHLVVRRIGEKFAIVVVINGDKLPHSDYLISLLKNILQDKFSLHYSINKSSNNIIMGDNLHLLHGNDRVDADMLGLKVKISPFSFMQVNDYIRDTIYTRVADMVEGSDRIVIDAYSGAGTLTALVARKVTKAIGIEIVPEAVVDADTLMKDNNLSHKVINICGDIKDVLPNLNFNKLNEISNINSNMTNTNAACTNNLINGHDNAFKENEEALNEVASMTLSVTKCDASDDINNNKIKDNDCTKDNNYKSNKGDAKELIYSNRDKDNAKDDNYIIDNDIMKDDNYNNRDNENTKDDKRNKKVTLILDPPRKGCDPKVIDSVLSIKPSQIIYISCNPATLARDLAILTTDNAYSIQSITPYDMFPQTSHLETLISLVRK